jgi:hypothetical protein
MRWTWYDVLELPQYVFDVLLEMLEQEAREHEQKS